MRNPKFVKHFKLCGAQLDQLISIKNAFEAKDQYVVSIACLDEAKQLYRVLSFDRFDTGNICSYRDVQVKAGRVEVLS